MSEIADFLRARITERREQADSIHRRDCESLPDVLHPGRETGACDCGEPESVVADCDAKLRMMDDADDFCQEYDNDLTDDNSAAQRAYYWRLTIHRNLVVAFAGHPDHKGEEWAP